eukprot:CAMPEP_0198262458 /NCGR_PEP_ID=MMETSP1447-20131203/10961_1 /TAXON_ID=420782 /ORGANISM="Chaetoceros dichaeta, Strain CCMP1751" /LENGTH=76 /DNA_ID=CAMNT_0043950709 /DNA_START=933 /DNA_END=1163 /DNA_ORIENTATION=-
MRATNNWYYYTIPTSSIGKTVLSIDNSSCGGGGCCGGCSGLYSSSNGIGSGVKVGVGDGCCAQEEEEEYWEGTLVS